MCLDCRVCALTALYVPNLAIRSTASRTCGGDGAEEVGCHVHVASEPVAVHLRPEKTLVILHGSVSPDSGHPTRGCILRSLVTPDDPRRSPSLSQGASEIGIFLPNNHRQHRTLHIHMDVLPYALC